jgi:hypothetical protein
MNTYTLKTFSVAALILVFMVGMGHQAFAYNLSDLCPSATLSGGYDFSDLGPLERSNGSWAFSDLGKDKSDMARFQSCNISKDTVDDTVSGNRDVPIEK